MIYLGLAIIALPFGWFLGLVAAIALSGGIAFGQLPMITVPAGLLSGFIIAFLPLGTPAGRLKLMTIATALMAVFFMLIPLPSS
jgi:hypothetical protein